MAWKVGKKIELNNSHQIATYRQLVNQEKQNQKLSTHKQLKALKDEMNKKNTYMQLFKGDGLIKNEKQSENDVVYVYD